MAEAKGERRYHIAVAFAAALLGTILFCVPVLLVPFGAEGMDPRAAFYLTPAFVLPLAIYLKFTGRIGWFGLIGLIVWVTAAHLASIIVISNIYKGPPLRSEIGDLWSSIYDTPGAKAARAAEWRARMTVAHRTALQGGAAAGALGAGLCLFILIPFGRSFRSLGALMVMAAATAALAGLGAFAFVETVPSEMRSTEYALRVFAPWQALFGLALAVLFAGERRAAATN